MHKGICLVAHPTDKQRKTLSDWMGANRYIWNCKCSQDSFLRAFQKWCLPNTYHPDVNQTYTQFKNKDINPWIFDIPSQILRNSVVNWYKTQKNFIKGMCGRPRKKHKDQGGAVHLTKELFKFDKCEDGVTRLFIGTKTNNIGFLSLKIHGKFKIPNSIHIKKYYGDFTVSFCYDDGLDESTLLSTQDHLKHLQGSTKEELEKITVGIDRGVKRPIQVDDTFYDLTEEQKRKKRGLQKAIRRRQRALARGKKGSNRRGRKKARLAKDHKKIANIRKDFAHKTSKKIVEQKETKVFIFENLNTSGMTKKPKPKKDEKTGKWESNNRRSKAVLNGSILDKGWYQLEAFVKYKAYRLGKAVFKVAAQFSSQECADCGHTHPDNRKTQELFSCQSCGHTDNADQNAARVIKKRAINFFLNSGTELSKRGVLSDSGRGATSKTRGENSNHARSKEASKKKGQATKACPGSLLL